MVKSIYERQNDTAMLRCLVAQRAEYNRAKVILKWKNRLTCVLAVLSIVATWLNLDLLTAVSFLATVGISIAFKHMDKYIDGIKKHAASIQQYIDATLYSEVLETNLEIWGVLPTNSDLAETAGFQDDAMLESVKNWYSDFSGLPAVQQVYNCQRENIRWDSRLRKSFSIFQIIIYFVVAGIAVMVAMWKNPELVQLICVLSWFMPIIDIACTNYQVLNNDIKRLEALHKEIEDSESVIKKGNLTESIDKLIAIQEKIKENRENSYSIPEWFYQSCLSRFQKQEDAIATAVQDIENDSSRK